MRCARCWRSCRYAILSGLKPPIVEPLVIVVGIILFGMLAGLLAVGKCCRCR